MPDSPLVDEWCGQFRNEAEVGEVGQHAARLESENTNYEKKQNTK